MKNENWSARGEREREREGWERIIGRSGVRGREEGGEEESERE